MNGTNLAFQDLPMIVAFSYIDFLPLFAVAFLLGVLRRKWSPGAPTRWWLRALYLAPLPLVIFGMSVPYSADLWLQARGWSEPLQWSFAASVAVAPLTTIVATTVEFIQLRRLPKGSGDAHA